MGANILVVFSLFPLPSMYDKYYLLFMSVCTTSNTLAILYLKYQEETDYDRIGGLDNNTVRTLHYDCFFRKT